MPLIPFMCVVNGISARTVLLLPSFYDSKAFYIITYSYKCLSLIINFTQHCCYTGAEATDSTLFGPANGVIWLFSANCGLHTCTAHNWANNDCLHTDDVAVTCPGLSFSYFHTHHTLFSGAPILRSQRTPAAVCQH